MKTQKMLFPACKGKDASHKCVTRYIGIQKGVSTRFQCSCKCHAKGVGR